MDYEPTQEEIQEEAKFLGIAPSDEKLLWIAKEALRAPLPRHWKPYQHKKTKAIVYYNSKTGVISENHPMDDYFRSLYMKLKSEPSPLLGNSIPQLITKDDFSKTSLQNSEAEANTQLYLTSLRTYDSRESEELCNEVHRLAVELSLFNEWMKDCVTSMKEEIQRIEYLDKRMQTSLNSVLPLPTS